MHTHAHVVHSLPFYCDGLSLQDLPQQTPMNWNPRQSLPPTHTHTHTQPNTIRFAYKCGPIGCELFLINGLKVGEGHETEEKQ